MTDKPERTTDMTDQTPSPRLVPNGHTLHWILDPGFDHGDLRIRYVDLRIAADTSPLDRMTGITVRGPRIVSDGVVTRGQFGKSMTLGALPEHLREQIIEAAKATRKPTVRHRDAITGQYVDADEAAARPETTVRETRKP